MQPIAIRHDTKAWKAQVWISFLAARCFAPSASPGCPGASSTAPS